MTRSKLAMIWNSDLNQNTKSIISCDLLNQKGEQ